MRVSSRIAPVGAAVLSVVLASELSPARAAVVTLLLQEGRNIPGLFPPTAPIGFSSSSVASNGKGYVVKLSLTTGDFLFGSRDSISSSSGSFLGFIPTATSGGATGTLPMAAMSSDGKVIFSTAGTPYRHWELGFGATTATAVAQAGSTLPAPLADAMGVSPSNIYGNFLSTFSYSDDKPVWRATWNNVAPANASTFPPNWALVKGYPNGTGADAPEVLVAPGMSFSNLPQPVASTTSIRAYEFTTVGVARQSSNHIVGVNMVRAGTITANNDVAMVLNGQGLVLGGTLVQERNLIPTSIGGRPGEDYRVFKAAAISATGDYGFRVQSFTTGGPGFAELLVVNGEVALREGNTLAYEGNTYTLGGGNLDYELLFNSNGDWVTNWNAAGGTDLIILNGQIIAASNLTPVDTDGDMIGDTTFGLTSLVIDRLALTDRNANGEVTVVFQGFGTGVNSTRQGVYAVTAVVPEPATLGLLALAAMGMARRRR